MSEMVTIYFLISQEKSRNFSFEVV